MSAGKLIFCTITIAILFGAAVEAQMNDSDSAEEQERIYDECVNPNRPKPEVEVGIHNDGLLCGKAISLPKPSYPDEAKAKTISGTVVTNIVVDEQGRAIWAKIVEGPQLLHDVSIKAACHVRYTPTKISNRAVKASGFITYRFVRQ